MMIAVALLFLNAVAAAEADVRELSRESSNLSMAPVRVRRFVHRHSCVGLDGEGGDRIGCAEADAAMFEHMLTPPQLWCNERDCVSDFNKTFEVHSIACTPQRCTVTLHCGGALEDVKYTVLLSLVAIVVLMCAPLYVSPRDIMAAAHARWLARLNKQL